MGANISQPTVLIGPFGGPDGHPWDDGSGSFTGVRSINLTLKDAIGSFCIVYDLNGNPVQEIKHLSGDSGYTTANASFKFSEERIIQVSGYIDILSPATPTSLVIRSITLKTDQKTYGPYGVEKGTPFSYQIPAGAYISGFVGRTSGDYLNAIGFYQTTP
ncbi:agglutinin alpha chain [Morus notabilis]|uniref:agglutinin alpha chain n=1 Tax=Morus notabilis TaxID=981085 RepID=UPI000CED7246|nr:agglutinin alpha chain [Morus notabilis]